MFLSAFDPSVANLFIQHQKRLSSVALELLAAVSSKDLVFFNETFPLHYSQLEGQTRRIFAANGALSFLSALPGIEQFHQRVPPFPFGPGTCVTSENIDLFLWSDTVRHLIGACEERGCVSILNGDGREESNVTGGAIVQEESDQEVYEEAQECIVQQICKKLVSGGMGVLIYGSNHFESGYEFEPKESRKKFESYLMHVPKTHVVVIEDDLYRPLMEANEQMCEKFDTLRPQQKRLIKSHMRKLEELGTIFSDSLVWRLLASSAREQQQLLMHAEQTALAMLQLRDEISKLFQ